MKYLFHNQNATYNTTQKSYVFTLGTKIRNATVLTIENCSFVLANYANPPHAVFLRSEHLTNAIKSKHSVTVSSGDSHDHQNSVLAILEESHTKGRYYLKIPQTFVLDSTHNIREIDFFFTDGDTVLDLQEVSTVITSSTDSDLEAINNLLLWTDMSNQNALLDVNNAVVDTAGDHVNYVDDRKSALLLYSLAYGSNGLVCNVGQTLGITRGANIGWQSFFDATAFLEGSLDDEFHFHSLFQLNDITAYCWLFDAEWLKLFMYQNALTVKTVQNNIDQALNLQVLQSKPYIISLQREQDANQNWIFTVRLENVEIGTSQNVQTLTCTATNQQSNANTNWDKCRIGNPSTHFSQFQSHMILCNGSNLTEYNNCIGWIKAKCQGTTTSTSETTETESSFTIYSEMK